MTDTLADMAATWNCRPVLIGSLLSALGLFIFLLYMVNNHKVSLPCSKAETIFNAHEDFEFIPAGLQSVGDCESLFVRTPANDFDMSAKFKFELPLFLYYLNQTLGSEELEGNSFMAPQLFRVLHHLASRRGIRHICETGFNGGHSALNFLTASPYTVVHSFDLGEHQYAYSMAHYLAKRFPGRLHVHFGDSRKTIPWFIRSNPDFRCDLLYIDGGHWYEIAISDLMLFASMANVERDVCAIVFDDYPSDLIDLNVGIAWEDMRRWGFLAEAMRCFEWKSSQLRGNYRRGFVLGKVIKRPTSAITSKGRNYTQQ